MVFGVVRQPRRIRHLDTPPAARQGVCQRSEERLRRLRPRRHLPRRRMVRLQRCRFRSHPRFLRPESSEAASRLAYEIRKAQPQRLLISYRWEALTGGYAVDGMDCSQIRDYVCNDYLMTSNPVDSYPGLRQNQAATGSWNCADGSGSKDRCIPSNRKWSSRFSLTGMREGRLRGDDDLQLHLQPVECNDKRGHQGRRPRPGISGTRSLNTTTVGILRISDHKTTSKAGAVFGYAPAFDNKETSTAYTITTTE